jgi:hypothetical protein
MRSTSPAPKAAATASRAPSTAVTSTSSSPSAIAAITTHIASKTLLAAALLYAAAAAAQASKVFDLALAGGKLAGAQTLRVSRGDAVELRWSSDRRIALHLHGYDVERTVAPGAPAVMAFKADIAGRFPVSEHAHRGRHGHTVLYLEVHP